MKLDLLGELRATRQCGELRAADAGQPVILLGWVQRRRDLGHLIFLDVRDRTGLVQVVANQEKHPEAHAKADQCRAEFVVGVVGTAAKREKPNPALASGEVEVVAEKILLLNEARTPPFPVEADTTASEETRLRHRYLDLRRPPLLRNLRTRHRVALAIRRFLDREDFLEIETPFLTRSTPEGARDYLVPSRVHPGRFYALPQSPQLFKQLLMIAGFDRYYQIVRCFRDEDLRADRQPEFTQLDLEMSFIGREAVFRVVEGAMKFGFAAANIPVMPPFPRISYAEALARFGTDKPDTRFGLELAEVSAVFKAAREALKIEIPVHAFVVPKAADTSRKQLDGFAEFVKAQGGRALYYAKVTEKAVESPLEKTLSGRGLEWLQEATKAAKGDLILVVPSDPAQIAGAPHAPTTTVIGALRSHVAQELKLIPAGKWNFLWVTDFPLFEWSAQENRWVSSHHPFTAPADDDLPILEAFDPGLPTEASAKVGKVRSKAYDLVLNGWELGSGSIRIHRQDVQQRIFRVLGLSDEESRQRFGFFLEALTYGTPPHGGIALGLDRVVALLCGEKSLREVIAFPKTATAQDLMANAPSVALRPQIEELEMMVAFPLLSKEDWELAGFNDRLLRFVDEKIFAREDLPSKTNYQALCALFLGASHATARGVVRLAKSGYGQSAAILARSLFEAWVTLAWIEQDQEARPNQYRSMELSLKKNAERLAAMSWVNVPPDTREKLAAYLEKEVRPSLPSLKERAKEVGAGEVYEVLYGPLSELAHHRIEGLISFLRGQDLDLVTVGPSREWVPQALATSFATFSDILKIFFRCFPEVDRQVPEKLFQEFQEYTARWPKS